MRDLLAVTYITVFSFILSLVIYTALKYEVTERTIVKFHDIYSGPQKGEKMDRTDKEIPGYIQRMCVESNELGIKIEKLNKFIESENSKNLSVEDRLDLLLQLNAMEEYALILKRRLDRAFKREGL